MNASKVARLLQQIKDEYEAAERGLTGVAQVAQHSFITKRLENMGNAHESLQQLFGPDEAMTLLAQTVWSCEDLKKQEHHSQ
jgi:hypothetical protein